MTSNHDPIKREKKLEAQLEAALEVLKNTSDCCGCNVSNVEDFIRESEKMLK